MSMSLAPIAPLAELAWLSAGVLLGIGGVVLRQRLHAWREARATEWDPY
jgi:hypothetical protein